jgi:formamidase
VDRQRIGSTKLLAGLFPRDDSSSDINNLSTGSKVFLPVYVKGGMVSVGDIHFCQGGEISFCSGIEMAGYLDMKAKAIEPGIRKLAVRTHLPAGTNGSALQ